MEQAREAGELVRATDLGAQELPRLRIEFGAVFAFLGGLCETDLGLLKDAKSSGEQSEGEAARQVLERAGGGSAGRRVLEAEFRTWSWERSRYKVDAQVESRRRAEKVGELTPLRPNLGSKKLTSPIQSPRERDLTARGRAMIPCQYSQRCKRQYQTRRGRQKRSHGFGGRSGWDGEAGNREAGRA